MKDLDWYLGVTYSYICQSAIMTDAPETFPDLDMPTIIPHINELPQKEEHKLGHPSKTNEEGSV